MKVYVETYGCSANRNNAEIIISKALAGGHEIVSSEKDADVVVVNTCTVKHITEQKIFSRLKKLKEHDVDVIVTGCMVPVQGEEIKNISKDLTLISWNELDKFNKIFGTYKSDAFFSYDKITKIVQINYGCLGNCSFCIVKLVKGSVESRSPEDILKEIEDALKRGYKEIYITSTDTAAYGFDIQKRLPDLINYVLETFENEDFIIRIGMMNPMLLRFFSKEYMELYKSPKVYKFLHMPIQSGSEKVLMEMQRPGKVEEFYKMHEMFMRITNNKGNFATDIIVGYPTETEEDFQKTVEVVKNLSPDMTHVSKFGPRKGTEAAMLKKLPSEVVKRRSKELSLLVKDIAKMKNKQWVGETTQVLVKEVEGGVLKGRNTHYKPVIIKNEKSKSYLGKWVKVKINDYTHAHLIGEIV